jgi:hypothetical protein
MVLECLLTVILASNPSDILMPSLQQAVRPGQPQRENTTPATKGTSIIRGRVTNAEGRPLRRVELRLTGSALDDPRIASTNAQGRFEIHDLPMGRYALTATRAGYIRTAYGELHPGDPSEAIEVSDGVTVDHVNITLPRTGVIAGTVLDEAGEPDAGTTVVAMQMRFANSKRRLVPVSRAVSDDIGQFRLAGLPPGNYYVEALSRDKWQSDPPEKTMMGFLPTFYPSAVNITEAQRIRLKLGQQVSGINVDLIAGKLVSISGTVMDAQGMPLRGGTVAVNQVMVGDNFAAYSAAGTAKTAVDGSFVIRDVSPGAYTLSVHAESTTGLPEVAQISVDATTDTKSIQLTTSPAGTVSGRIVLDPGATLPSTFPLTRLRVAGKAVDDVARVNFSGFMVNGGRVADDGAFTVNGVTGQTRFTVAPLPPGWAVKRVDYNGADITGTGTDPLGRAVDGVLITLTDKFPSVSGTLHDDRGNPTPAATTIVFPEDPTLWDSVLNTVRIARVDKSGEFSIQALRPGGYLAVAVAAVGPNALMDPDVLESLRPRATRLVVAEGDTKRLDLVVVSLSPQ